jgi:hypothetical protein
VVIFTSLFLQKREYLLLVLKDQRQALLILLDDVLVLLDSLLVVKNGLLVFQNLLLVRKYVLFRHPGSLTERDLTVNSGFLLFRLRDPAPGMPVSRGGLSGEVKKNSPPRRGDAEKKRQKEGGERRGAEVTSVSPDVSAP